MGRLLHDLLSRKSQGPRSIRVFNPDHMLWYYWCALQFPLRAQRGSP
jgi:hypothetical protein